MPVGFQVRGVIEGFYGPPWSSSARRRAFDTLGPLGMNAYVWAPKDDPHHRRRWREPHPPGDLDALLGDADRAERAGVTYGYSLAPGLDADPSSGHDRTALHQKLTPLVDGGVRWFVLAFDDIPPSPGAGRAHADLVDHARELAPDARWTVVPTDYVGTRPTPYLDELTERLPDDVDLMWTGSTVVPATITATEARARREATNGQPVLVWDNYPVNDAFMARSLHLGPLTGRDPELAGVCEGVLANPMSQAEASLVPLATVAEFLREPSTYEPATAWLRALDEVAGGDPGVGALARACATSRLQPRAPLHDLVDAVETGRPGATGALRRELAAAPEADAVPELLREEAAPWLEQLTRETQLAEVALSVLEREASRPPDEHLQTVFTMLFLWSEVRASSPHVVHGARLACYPAITQTDGGGFTVDPVGAVVDDASAVDRLCRLAVARQPAPLRAAGGDASPAEAP